MEQKLWIDVWQNILLLMEILRRCNKYSDNTKVTLQSTFYGKAGQDIDKGNRNLCGKQKVHISYLEIRII